MYETNIFNQLKLTIIISIHFQKIKIKQFNFHFSKQRNTVTTSKTNLNTFITHNQQSQTTIQLTIHHHFDLNKINFYILYFSIHE